jgi:pentatricopeptide repeat protein
VSRDGVPFCLTRDGELNIIALHCAMLEVVGRKKLLDQVADVYARMIEDGHP